MQEIVVVHTTRADEGICLVHFNDDQKLVQFQCDWCHQVYSKGPSQGFNGHLHLVRAVPQYDPRNWPEE